MKHEYQCSKCKGVFLSNRSDEEAYKEYEERLERGFYPLAKEGGKTGILCDDCYSEFLVWLNQNRYNKSILPQ